MAALQHSLLARLNTTPGCVGELVKSYLQGTKFGMFTSDLCVFACVRMQSYADLRTRGCVCVCVRLGQ